MLISKINLAVLECAAKNSDNAYMLDHVKIDKGMMWSCNAHALYGSKLVKWDAEAYPDMDVNGIDYDGCMLIPAAALAKAEKNIPKSRIPALENIQILIDENFKHLVTTDLDTTNDVKIKHPECTEWPNHQAIIDSIPKYPESEVVLNVEQLDTLVKVLKRNKQEFVKISLYGGRNPVGVKAKGLVALIMPCAADGEDCEDFD